MMYIFIQKLHTIIYFFRILPKENKRIKYVFYFVLCSLLSYYGLTFYLHDIYGQDSKNIAINKTKLTESLYLLHGPNANVLVSIGKDGTLLVDDEMTDTSEQLQTAISEITDNPIKFVINTHWHPDHTEGNIKFGKEGAIIIAHDSVRDRLSKNQYDPYDDTNTSPLPETALPIITFSDNMTLYHNNDEIKIIHAPGHTDGDSIVFFTKDNVIYLGDLFDDHEYPSINI